MASNRSHYQGDSISMIVLRFYKGQKNTEYFVLHYSSPLSAEPPRFINADDKVNVAKLYIGNKEFELKKAETIKVHQHNQLPALEFSLTLSEEQMSQLGKHNKGYVTLDGVRVEQELTIGVY